MPRMTTRAVPVHRGPGYSSNAWALTHGFSADAARRAGRAGGARLAAPSGVLARPDGGLAGRRRPALGRGLARALPAHGARAQRGVRLAVVVLADHRAGPRQRLPPALQPLRPGRATSLFCGGDGVDRSHRHGRVVPRRRARRAERDHRARLSHGAVLRAPAAEALGGRLPRLGPREPRGGAALHHRHGRRPPGHRQHGVQGGGLRRAPVPAARRHHRRRSATASSRA